MADPKITVTRKDDGILTFEFKHDTKIITATGYWDDATPWEAGTYNVSFWLFGMFLEDSFRFGTRANPNPIPKRTNIVIHEGSGTGSTAGCLVDGNDFIEQVYAYLRGKGLAPSWAAMRTNYLVHSNYYNEPWKPITIEVKDENGTGYDYEIELSLDESVTLFKEGKTVNLKIELTGSGATNGISKDLWFHLNFSGTGSLMQDLDASLQAHPEGAEDDKQWVKLPAKQTETIIPLLIKFDNFAEGEETFDVKIDDYIIRRVSSRFLVGEQFYKSEGPFPINGPNDQVSFTVEDQEDILGQTISKSGGQGTFTFDAPFAPEQIVTGTFTPFTIPDRLIIRDGANTLLDTGSVSGYDLPINFTIPAESGGNITILVEAPLGGTLWEFTLISENVEQQEVHSQQILTEKQSLPLSEKTSLTIDNMLSLAAEVTVADISANQAQWKISTNTSSVLLEGAILDTATGPSFTLKRIGNTSQEAKIGWRVKPIGGDPVSAEDFEIGKFPQGVVTLIPGYSESKSIYFEAFDTNMASPTDDYFPLKKDGLKESVETFTIELFDPNTSLVITPVAIEGRKIFSVHDTFGFVPTTYGTNAAETLEGNNKVNDVRGRAGDDVILGLGENDYLYGENGDDVINGGDGDDEIEGGFGNDQIDGGAGYDTVIIARPQSMLDIQRQNNGSYKISDFSNVSLGIDTVANIETLILADGSAQLGERIFLPRVANGVSLQMNILLFLIIALRIMPRRYLALLYRALHFGNKKVLN